MSSAIPDNIIVGDNGLRHSSQVVEHDENGRIIFPEKDAGVLGDSGVNYLTPLVAVHDPLSSSETETHSKITEHDKNVDIEHLLLKPADETHKNEISKVSIPDGHSIKIKNDQNHDFQPENVKQEVKSGRNCRRRYSRKDGDKAFKFENRKLTSWECFTTVLKGLVDELISLGARPKLRKVIFQLWALYLKQECIAFFSYAENKLPPLPHQFKNSDAKALYNIKKLRSLIVDDLIKDGASRTRKIKKLNSENCRLKVKIPSKNKKVNAEQLPVRGKRLKNTEQKENVKVALKKSAFDAIAELTKNFKRQKEKYGKNIPSNVLQWYRSQKYSNRKMKANNSFTINTLLAIIRLALFLIEDDIQLSDLLRWTSEGRFSVYQVTKFLLEDPPIREADVVPCTRNNFLKIDLLRFTKMLHIDIIPSPNLFKLIERYCDELSLPKEVTMFAQRLMNMFTPHMDFTKYDYRAFPDYECRAMGFIVFALKLLFSLDDITEVRQSHFTHTLNNCNREAAVNDVPTLFSWSSWVRYIECRKAVLCKYDVTMSHLYECDHAKTDMNVFLNYWNKNKPDTFNYVASYSFNRYTINRLEKAAKADYIRKEKLENLKFPPTLTPLKTYTHYLLANHENLLSDRCRQILSDNFSSYSIRYLLDQKWTIEISKHFGLEVEPICDSAVTERVHYAEPKSNVVTLSNTVPAHIPTPVQIINDDKPSRTKNAEILKKFRPKFTPLKPTADEKKFNCLELFYPSRNYWFFHHIDRSMKNENFSKIAFNNLPTSFLWLLKECCGIVRCSLYELYTELVMIERIYYYLYADGNEYSDDKLIIYANEW